VGGIEKRRKLQRRLGNLLSIFATGLRSSVEISPVPILGNFTMIQSFRTFASKVRSLLLNTAGSDVVILSTS
jgi:hypothetical protein